MASSQHLRLYSGLLLTTAGASVAIAGLLWRRRRVPGAGWLAAATLGVGEWAFCYAGELLARDPQRRVAWAKAQYLGIATVPTAVACSALAYTGRPPTTLARGQQLTLIVPPLLTLAQAMTNEQHRQIWRLVVVARHGDITALRYTYGRSFWLYTAHAYGLTLLTLVRLFNFWRHAPALYRRQAGVMLVGTIVPWLANVLYLTRRSPLHGLDLTPFAFAATCAAFAAGIKRYRFFEVMPVARERLVNEMSDGVVVLDLMYRIIDLNPAAERIFACTASSVTGLPVERLVHELGPICRTAPTTDGHHELVVQSQPDWRTFDIKRSALSDARRRQIGWLLVLRDISEHKRAAEERLTFERRLQATQRLESLGVLSSGIAHDFNNLLTCIIGYNELALSEPLTATTNECVTSSIAAARRAADLVQQMLTYAGNGQSTFKPITINELVLEIGSLLRASIAKQIVINRQLATDLPPVDADAAQLRQVLLNLIINAAEAIGDQPGTITISTDTAALSRADLQQMADASDLQPGPYVRLTVSDTGCGMNAAIQSRIFEPFYSTKFAGRGLGLAVALGVVRSHRGLLTLDSRPNVGTTFQIWLPAAAGEASPDEPENCTTPLMLTRRTLMLIIDDEPEVRAVVARMVHQLGFAVHSVADGLSGIEFVRRAGPDLAGVLLDMTMPYMSGSEVARRIAAIRPQLPIVLMSGYSSADPALHYAGMYLAGFLQKPFSYETLRRTLEPLTLTNDL